MPKRKRQGRKWLPEILDDGRQQHGKLGRYTLDRRPVEQIGAVFERAEQICSACTHEQGEVELRSVIIQRNQFGRRTGEVEWFA